MTDVLEIYQAYPRKEGKRAALAEIEKALKRIMEGECGMLPQDIHGHHLGITRSEAVIYLLDRVKEYALSPAGNRGTLTPHPRTWFHQSRYVDDPHVWGYLTPEEDRRMRRSVEANVGVYRPQ